MTAADAMLGLSLAERPSDAELANRNIAERTIRNARALVSDNTVGGLGTMFPAESEDPEPYFPYNHLTDFVDDVIVPGTPIMPIARISLVYKCLQADARAALILGQPDCTEDPWVCHRMALLGRIVQLEDGPELEARKAAFFAAHPGSEAYVTAHDFDWFKLDLEYIHYVGGFGDRHYIGWIPVDRFLSWQWSPAAVAPPSGSMTVTVTDTASGRASVGRLHFSRSLDRLAASWIVPSEDVAGDDQLYMTALYSDLGRYYTVYPDGRCLWFATDAGWQNHDFARKSEYSGTGWANGVFANSWTKIQPWIEGSGKPPTGMYWSDFMTDEPIRFEAEDYTLDYTGAHVHAHSDTHPSLWRFLRSNMGCEQEEQDRPLDSVFQPILEALKSAGN